MHRIARKTCRTALAVAASLLVASSPLVAKTFEHTYDAGPGGRLEVDTDVGSIEVRSSASAKAVEVEVTVTGSNVDDFTVEFDDSGGHPVVRGDYRRSRSFFGGSSPRVRFRITVPERYDVDLETAGGSIEVDDLTGEVVADTSGGSLEFGRIDGSIHGETSGGSIQVRAATGDVEVRTSGGSIDVGDVGGRLRVRTSGGSIELGRIGGPIEAETSGGSIEIREAGATVRARTSAGSVTAYLSGQPDGDCSLTTSAGSVTVYLAEGIGVDVDARSSGGRVASDFHLDGERKSRTSLAGSLNGGGPRLHLQSSGGGSVSVRER